MTKERKPRKKSEKQLLITALLGLTENPRPIRWDMEMRWLCFLLKKKKDPNFWFFLAKHHTFISLYHLIPQEDLIFRTELEYTKQKFLELKTRPSEKLEQEKIGEDIIVPQKQKTLLDFVNS